MGVDKKRKKVSNAYKELLDSRDEVCEQMLKGPRGRKAALIDHIQQLFKKWHNTFASDLHQHKIEVLQDLIVDHTSGLDAFFSAQIQKHVKEVVGCYDLTDIVDSKWKRAVLGVTAAVCLTNPVGWVLLAGATV